MTVGFIEHYPATLHPVGEDGELNLEVSVEVFQLRPTDALRLTDWSGLTGYPGADGGVLLLDGAEVAWQVRLGEFLIRDAHGGLRLERSAAELFRQYQPATSETEED